MDLNYLAVFVAALASIALGFVWYMPAVFGNMWLKTLPKETRKHIEKENKKNMAPVMILALVGSLITAYVFAYLADAMTWQRGLVFGVWIWFGFSMPMSLGTVLWEKKSWANFLINTTYNLVMFALIGAILGGWQ